MKPEGNLNIPLEIYGYTDADYTGDNNTWKSVIGYIVLLNGVDIAWCSRSQKIVTFSVKEAEYSVVTEVC